MSNLDFQINNLLAGQSIISSKCNNIVCSIERSGDGKTLRFIRTYENGSFAVYRTVDFYFV
jgi:hypothetical protein